MKMKKRLEALSQTGKVKFIEVEVDGPYLITRWGYVDGKVQETKELCQPKNVGKTNETTAEEQAVFQFERKIKKKIEEGYSEGSIKVDNKPDFDSLQKYFAPCKPISKPPDDCLSGNYLADRKYNGVNIIFTRGQDTHVYTRRIDEITNNIQEIPEIKKVLDNIPPNTILLSELVYINNDGIEEPEMLRGLINKSRTKEMVLQHYHDIIKRGELIPVIFDILFWKGKDMSGVPFLKRRGILRSIDAFTVPKIYKFNDKLIEFARRRNWEGFILRKENGLLKFTMNGKPARFGSWKWKFEYTDDFIVLDATHGKGKHANHFARFLLGQFNNDGDIVEMGWCGPGKLSNEELDELYKSRHLNGRYRVKPYLVVEVLFRARTKYGKLEFPVLQRIRDDKRPEECKYNE